MSREPKRGELGMGKELIVDIEVNHRGTHDLYIDDIIALTLDVPGTNNLETNTHGGTNCIRNFASGQRTTS